ncbi:MAG: hypothetical protein V4592_01505 [Bacteroidota bacterium]
MNLLTPSALLRSALFLCLMIMIQACTAPSKPGIYKNNLIPSGTRDKMHDLTTNLIGALKTNTTDELEQLMSQDLIDDRPARMAICEQISIRMKDADYSLMSEYYLVNPPNINAGTHTIKERDLGINNFDLTFSGSARETYVALITPKSAMQKWLITAIYHKYDYGWKVAKLEINPYAENGRTAPELIEQAKEQAKNGYWLDASNSASYAERCLRPYTTWKYVAEDSIYRYNGEALKVVMSHYKLPLTITEVPTHPRIWRIRVERTKDGAFPNVNYLSTIKLYDTVALKKENELVGKAIGHVMAGIDKDKKYIYYTIYNETEKGIPYRDHYDLKQKL